MCLHGFSKSVKEGTKSRWEEEGGHLSTERPWNLSGCCLRLTSTEPSDVERTELTWLAPSIYALLERGRSSHTCRQSKEWRCGPSAVPCPVDGTADKRPFLRHPLPKQGSFPSQILSLGSVGKTKWNVFEWKLIQDDLTKKNNSVYLYGSILFTRLKTKGVESQRGDDVTFFTGVTTAVRENHFTVAGRLPSQG